MDIKEQQEFTLSRWSLEDLYPSADAAEMHTAFTELEEKVAAFEKHRAQLDAQLPGFFHGFDGIVRNILKDLPQLGGVTLNLSRFFAQRKLNGKLIAMLILPFEVLSDLPQHRLEVQ